MYVYVYVYSTLNQECTAGLGKRERGNDDDGGRSVVGLFESRVIVYADYGIEQLHT